ncbi:MAG: ABC transporter permease [Methanomassiliicoccaceae archaeon]|nr:ABC transporter permease [Methanomassiliicoccaceae archaeon]
MMYIELDDFRQSYVVAKNEIRKFIRGKRFTVYVALTALVFGLMTFLPYIVGGDLRDIPGGLLTLYTAWVYLLALLAATLFASIVIVSEFEERTALVLFTRPIKKTSIFVGKLLGCLILETAMIATYYAGTAAVLLIIEGSVSIDLLISLGMALLYLLAASGIAVFFSSILKKGSTSSIVTFFTLFLFIRIISVILMIFSDTDPWFMIDQASNAIIAPDMLSYLDMMQDTVRAALTMVAWGAVSIVSAWLVFIRREF